MLLAAAREFIDKHLIPRIPPPIGWSAGSSAWLKKKFPANTSPRLTATSASIELATRLYALKKIQKALDRSMGETENRLKLMIGEADGIRGVGWELRWKRCKDSQYVDWEQVARWIAQSVELPAEDFKTVVSTFTETRPGARRFGPHKLPDQLFYRLLGQNDEAAIDAIKVVSGPLLGEEKETGENSNE
jgi:hypothetical protein